MRAIVQDRYGSSEVLELRDVPTPRVADGNVLVRVRAASVDRGTWHLMTGMPYVMRAMGFGVRAPKARIPGVNLSGTVEAAGARVTAFRAGDHVYGTGTGAFGELACSRADRLAPKPTGLSFEEAATIPHGGTAALQGLRDRGRLGPDRTVLVNGASGSVGTFVTANGAPRTDSSSSNHRTAGTGTALRDRTTRSARLDAASRNEERVELVWRRRETQHERRLTWRAP